MQRTMLIALLPILLVCCGCAVLNDNNRPTLNLVEARLRPADREPTFSDWALIVPVGTLAVAADALVVHPVMVLDDAWRDTKDAVWSEFEWKEHYVTECALLPLRALMTPVWFLPDWLIRGWFDVEPNTGEDEAKVEELKPDEPQPTAAN